MEAFLALIEQVFSATFFGITAWHAVGGTLVLILFVLLRNVFARTVITYLSRLTQKSKTDLDDKILEALTEPLKFIPIVLGVFFITQWFALPADIATVVTSLARSMVAFAVFWAIYKMLRPFSAILEKLLAKLTFESETLFAEEFIGLIMKSLRIAIIVVGAMVVLSQWGVNLMPVLGGLGILGMAVGFGAQDTIANIFGGIKILFDGQFKRGDWIKTPDIEGTVIEIGIATTKVREFDKAVTSIPNKQLADATIKNYTKMTNRRIKLTIGVEYSSRSNQLENIVDRLKDYLRTHPDIAQPGEAPVVQMVHLTNFGGSSIDISLYYFTKTTSWAPWLDIRHENMLEFKRIVESEGAAFAFPSSSVYLESTPSEPKTVDDVERYESDIEQPDENLGSYDDSDGDGGDG